MRQQPPTQRTTRPVDPFASIARTLANHHREALEELLDHAPRTYSADQ
jgi:hypothetical protein